MQLTLPIPPMPTIPSVLSLGSWPIGVFPRHLPSRIAMIGIVACLSAPSRRKMPTSAVALSTAIGVLDIRIPVAVSQEAQEYVVSTGNTPFWFKASTSTLSYPAPLWQMYLSDLGRRETNSLSKGPVSCPQVLAIFFHTLAFDIRRWSYSSGTVLRHRRILPGVVSAGSPFCCQSRIPGAQSVPCYPKEDTVQWRPSNCTSRNILSIPCSYASVRQSVALSSSTSCYAGNMMLKDCGEDGSWRCVAG
jgi:hypothetical protein